MHSYYILDENRNPQPVDNLLTWASWFEDANRSIAKTTIGNMCVSTIFLGLNYQFDEGPPLLYETVVFGPGFESNDRYGINRYTTHIQALAGHDQIVAQVQADKALK